MLCSLSGSFPHFDRVDPIGTGSFMHKLNYFVKRYEIFPLQSQNKSFFLFSYIFRQFLKHFVLLKVNYYFWFSNKKQFVTNMFWSFFFFAVSLLHFIVFFSRSECCRVERNEIFGMIEKFHLLFQIYKRNILVAQW